MKTTKLNDLAYLVEKGNGDFVFVIKESKLDYKTGEYRKEWVCDGGIRYKDDYRSDQPAQYHSHGGYIEDDREEIVAAVEKEEANNAKA